MGRRYRRFALLTVVLALMAGFVSATTGAELVVLLASVSDTLPANLNPAPGAPCAESLKALKAAGLKIIDVKGGSALVYTLQREALFGRPAAVAVIYCGPAEPEAKK